LRRSGRWLGLERHQAPRAEAEGPLKETQTMPMIKKSGYDIRLPKGQRSMSPAQDRAVQDLLSRKSGRLSNAKGCVIVPFKKRGGGVVAAQRCENRSLSTSAKRRYNKTKGKLVCRTKSSSGKYHKGQFRPCR
jgi:hypothetical protein